MPESLTCNLTKRLTTRILDFKHPRHLSKTSAVSQGMLVLGDQGLRSVSTFLAAMLVGRACGEIEYGFYTLLLTILFSAEEFQMALISTPYIVQNPSKAGMEKKIFLGNAVVIQFLVASITSICLFGFLNILHFNDSDKISVWILPAFTLAFFSVLLREFLRQVLLSDLNVFWNLVFGTTVHLSLILALSGLYFRGGLNAWTAYISITLCSFVPSVGVLWFKRRYMSLNIRGLLRQFLNNWNIGRWLAAQALVTIASGPVYFWVLAYSRGAEAVALLGASLLPGSIMSPLVQALKAFLLPKTSHAVYHGIQQVRSIVIKSTIAAGLALSVFPIMLGIFSSAIMTALYGGRYNPSGWLVMLLALRVYFIVLGTPINSGLIACRQTYAIFKSEMISLLLTVLIGLPLTILWGLWGVVWGFLLTRFFSRAYLAVAFNRYVKSVNNRIHIEAAIPVASGSAI